MRCCCSTVQQSHREMAQGDVTHPTKDDASKQVGRAYDTIGRAGQTTTFTCYAQARASFARVDPRIIAPIISAATDSNTSALLPTQSPTMSPTRSATTAGFRGSSSGMPVSTFRG